MRFEIYKDVYSYWRWRLITKNGRVLTVSATGFVNKSNAKRSVKTIQEYLWLGNAPVIEVKI